ncbi:MAG: hypothetical protein ACPG7F_14840 [Aggregatilineales bacterium]
MINPPLRLMMTCQQHLSDNPDHLLKVPGRELWIAANIRDDGIYTLILPDLDARTSFTHRSLRRNQTRFHRPLPQWATYPAAILPVLKTENYPLPGYTAVIVGDEPPGVRYNYALGMALAALAYTHHETPCDEDTLLAIMQQVTRGQ